MVNNHFYEGFTIGNGTFGDKAKHNLSIVHENVYGNTGGLCTKGGNMASVPAAGFDPTFFLKC
ncbi:hypothetical protein BGX38DRAFT_1173465 [Terfezia claveryi]|nr:hypothetical protein BGX38DRAFT_1173465 [Terfezia claveryi]